MSRRMVSFRPETADGLENSRDIAQGGLGVWDAFPVFMDAQTDSDFASGQSPAILECVVVESGNICQGEAMTMRIWRPGTDGIMEPVGTPGQDDEGRIIGHYDWMDQTQTCIEEGTEGIAGFFPNSVTCGTPGNPSSPTTGQSPPFCHTGWRLIAAVCESEVIGTNCWQCGFDHPSYDIGGNLLVRRCLTRDRSGNLDDMMRLEISPSQYVEAEIQIKLPASPNFDQIGPKMGLIDPIQIPPGFIGAIWHYGIHLEINYDTVGATWYCIWRYWDESVPGFVDGQFNVTGDSVNYKPLKIRCNRDVAAGPKRYDIVFSYDTTTHTIQDEPITWYEPMQTYISRETTAQNVAHQGWLSTIRGCVIQSGTGAEV